MITHTRTRRQTEVLHTETRAFSSRLTAVKSSAERGILGFNRDRQVAVVNPKALHILGGFDRNPPFDWPDEIKFVDPSDMKPFGARQSPIEHALLAFAANNRGKHQA